jgi:hypothetical protein
LVLRNTARETTCPAASQVLAVKRGKRKDRQVEVRGPPLSKTKSCGPTEQVCYAALTSSETAVRCDVQNLTGIARLNPRKP